MSKTNTIYYSEVEKEGIILILKKKSEWDYWYGLLWNFFLNTKKDYLIITKKRIIYILKDDIKCCCFYSDFDSIKYNSFNDLLSFVAIDGKTKNLSLKSFRITYEEIKQLKEVLN